jgi:hypothetical protein
VSLGRSIESYIFFYGDRNNHISLHPSTLLFSHWGFLMQRTRQHNSEYMQVVCEVVSCLVNQLHHPQLSSPSADEIVDWFRQVNKEVEIAIEQLREAKRIP